MSSNTVQWCNLPKDLLLKVTKCLDTCTDILRLRAVCSPWRSLLPHSLNDSRLFSVKFPFPVAPNPDLNPKCSGYFTLTVSTICYLEPCSFENPNASASPKGWMVKVEHVKPGKVRILDMFSGQKLAGWFRVSPKVLNLLNFEVSEVRHIGHLQLFDTDYNEMKSNVVKKVVMSAIPLLAEDSYGDCAILTIHTGGKLGYIKLGDDKWTMIDDGQGKSHYEDILYCNDQFYAVDSRGKMIVIDSSLNVRVIESPVHGDRIRDGIRDGVKYKTLVESNGDLYLVDKYFDWYLDPYYDDEDDYFFPDRLIIFKVYKLNDDKQEWVQVTSLGDQAFFIGDDCCFSVSASQFSGCKGNCIYFTDSEFVEEDHDGRPGYDVGIFDLEKDTSEPLSSFKGYSRIFWPPPAWLRPKVSSKQSSSRR